MADEITVVVEPPLPEIRVELSEVALAGPQGVKGDRGSVGPKGDQGDIGPTGADSTVPGPKGDQGDIGLTGPQGDKGDTGDIGPIGPQGDTGSQGPKGDTGTQGIQGPALVYDTTSSTSITNTSGVSKTFALDHPCDLKVGQFVRVFRTSLTTTFMGGIVTAVSPTSITILMSEVAGPSGPYSDWGIVLAGRRGAPGADSTVAGPQGQPGIQGVKGDTGSQGPKGDTGDVGPAGPTNAVVSDDLADLPENGLLVQTGLGDGTGFTLWFDDGSA